MFKINRNKVIKYYLFISLFILAFVEIETAGTGSLKVFAIEQNKGLTLFIATIVAMLMTFLFKDGNKKIDMVIVFLVIKCIIDLIPYINGQVSKDNYWYFYIMIVIAPLIYWVFKQYDGELGTVINAVSLFGVLLVCQTIITVVKNGFGYSTNLYKYNLRIPLAHSNIIGVVLLTLFVLRIASNRKNGMDRAINIILVFGLILIQSRGSWVFLIVWAVYMAIKKSNEQRKYLMSICIVCMVIVGMFVFLFSSKIQMLLLSTTIDNFDYSVISSGRFDIFALAFAKWMENPLLGIGLGVTSYDIGREVISTGVHNIILDYGVQSGLIGVTVYMVAVIKGLRSRKYADLDWEDKGLFFAILAIFAYSMFEVCYNNFVGIFFFWMFMGLYNSRRN